MVRHYIVVCEDKKVAWNFCKCFEIGNLEAFWVYQVSKLCAVIYIFTSDSQKTYTTLFL
jgi:hypothetical protein